MKRKVDQGTNAPKFKAQIEMLDPNILVPYEHNSRVHSEEQVKEIAKQIVNFGFDQPIVVDEQKIIIKGHGRRLACIYLGLKEIPVIVRKDLNEKQKVALRIGDNRVSDFATWDKTKLKIDINWLHMKKFDLSLTSMPEYEFKPLIDMGKKEDGSGASMTTDDEDHEKTFIIQYNIIFNSTEEQQTFFDFLLMLKTKYPDKDTVAERIVQFITDKKD